MDNRAIYHQIDEARVEWQFNGRDWQRQGAFARGADGHDAPSQAPVRASYAKSQELGAMANAKAIELALGKVPPPQDPFNLPAKPGDQTGLDNQNWQRNPTTESWERQVKTGVAGANDQGVYAPQTATQSRRTGVCGDGASGVKLGFNSSVPVLVGNEGDRLYSEEGDSICNLIRPGFRRHSRPSLRVAPFKLYRGQVLR
ncbi:hypothetical protein XAXN_02455 [Xanthomonas axonopodis]|uniref:Uncharacterized protein n=1 Tax=Xanthomonas axonopodis TaxID=53413 RepID=A0A0P6VUB1_9XANT|nr:hypothetical protein XAXN_02455 [Xanthomonas axonopodis]